MRRSHIFEPWFSWAYIHGDPIRGRTENLPIEGRLAIHLEQTCTGPIAFKKLLDVEWASSLKIGVLPNLVTLEGIEANSNVLMIAQGMCSSIQLAIKKIYRSHIDGRYLDCWPRQMREGPTLMFPKG